MNPFACRDITRKPLFSLSILGEKPKGGKGLEQEIVSCPECAAKETAITELPGLGKFCLVIAVTAAISFSRGTERKAYLGFR